MWLKNATTKNMELIEWACSDLHNHVHYNTGSKNNLKGIVYLYMYI